MSNVVKLDWNFALKDKLATLPERILVASEREANEIMEMAKAYAQGNCPVSTGALRDSIRIEQGPKSKFGFTIRLRAGGYVTNPRTGHLVDYASYVEGRYGFLKAAALVVEAQIAEAIRKAAVEEAER